MHLLRNEENEKWIQDYVDRETAVARNHVKDPETTSMQELEDMRNAEKAGSTPGKPETTFDEMLYPIGDSLRDLASSNDEVDCEGKADAEQDSELGSLSQDGEPGWEMGSVRNGSGYPASSPGWDRKNGSVRFRNRPKTRPAASWRSVPSPAPVNPRVSPGLAIPVRSNLRFCILGCAIYVSIQISYS